MQTFRTSRFSTWIFLILIVLTAITYTFGEANVVGESAMLMILLITMIKSQLVAHYFMGLANCKRIWRAIMFGYFMMVGGLIAIAYLMGNS